MLLALFCQIAEKFDVALGLSLIHISIGVAYLTCGTRHRIENFAVAFGNAGFIGIPLVTAVFAFWAKTRA